MILKSVTFNKFFCRFLGGLLALLGFASCDDDVVMYGTPVDTFKPMGSYDIKGVVTDERGNAVSGATMLLRNEVVDGEWVTIYDADVRTDADGKYQLVGSAVANSKVRIVCRPDDKVFYADSVEIVLENPEYNGGNIGTAKAEENFTLRTK